APGYPCYGPSAMLCPPNTTCRTGACPDGTETTCFCGPHAQFQACTPSCSLDGGSCLAWGDSCTQPSDCCPGLVCALDCMQCRSPRSGVCAPPSAGCGDDSDCCSGECVHP